MSCDGEAECDRAVENRNGFGVVGAPGSEQTCHVCTAYGCLSFASSSRTIRIHPLFSVKKKKKTPVTCGRVRRDGCGLAAFVWSGPLS